MCVYVCVCLCPCCANIEFDLCVHCVCVCVTNSLGLSALRSGTYHGSHSTSRPGIAFRGQVYQPTEMALVMNGGTVSTETRHAPLNLHLLPHSVLVHLADAHGPNQLHRTSAVVMWRKGPREETIGASWSLQKDIEALAHRTVSVRWKLNIIDECVCDSLHTCVTFTSLGPSLSCSLTLSGRGRHTLYVCNRSSISRRIIPHCDIESNASKTTFGHLWKSASYTHRANTAFVT